MRRRTFGRAVSGVLVAALAGAATAPLAQVVQPQTQLQPPLVQLPPGYLGPTVQRQQTLQDAVGRLTANERAAARAGSTTEAEGGPTLDAAAGRARRLEEGPTPFGASLFEGGAPTSSEAVNPDYQIQPGDRIGVSVLGAPGGGGLDSSGAGAGAGAVSAAGQNVLVVDPQGNVFMPEVGAVHVGGVRAGALQGTLQAAASRSFTSNVRLYAVLLTTHRIGVYVAGFVAKPGRYAGGAADSVLDYLIRAGGVDPSRGSYRHIEVRRGGARLASVDLYDFLLSGVLPTPNLREGDTIFVQKQGPTVTVDGSVRNDYLFELAGPAATGSTLIELARPLPAASDAVLTGTREGKPFSQYLTLAALARAPLVDQDRVTFVSDRARTSVRVRVEGSRIGPSVLVLPTDSRLPTAVAQVRVDPALADLGSVYVLRRTVAEQQQRVITEAADRLERSLFLARSPTSGVATIRASEAQLISSYIQRARRATPDGRIVTTDDAGRIADLRLEEDDVIVIPAKSQTVLVSGEVLQPQAILYRPGLRRDDYVRLAGGFSERGRRGRFLIRRANGALLLDRNVVLRPGDELVALPYIDPKYFQLGADVLSLVYQVAIAAALARNTD